MTIVHLLQSEEVIICCMMAGKLIFTSTLALCISILALRYYQKAWLYQFTGSSMHKLRQLGGYFLGEQQGMVATSQLHLAMIDMTEAKKDSKRAAAKIYKALSEVGFAYLVNVPGYEPDELYKYTKWYFDLPLQTKMRMAKNAFQPENANAFRGYFPVIPGGHSFKEALEFGAFFDVNDKKEKIHGSKRPLMRDVVHESNVWPETNDKQSDKEFRRFMTGMYGFYSSVGNEVTQLMAEGLGLDKSHFDNLFKPGKPLSTLRLLHYPTRINETDIPEEAKDGDVRITTGEHFDTAFLTILATFNNKGLQLKLADDGPWLDVPPINDGFLINIGALLAQMVDGRFKATNHRVIDLGIDRYSVPFFHEPKFDGDISKSLSGKVINSVLPKYGPWMTNRTSMFAEYATTDFGIVD